MQIKNLLLLVLFIVGVKTFAQEQTFTALKVGDAFPDYPLKNMINYPEKTLDLKTLRGKLVILDLWGTTCTACVNAWPKMLSLHKEFKGQVEIVLVNIYEDEKKVRPFLEQRKKLVGVNMNLPMTCGDRTLKQMVPELGVPRYLWIDQNGILSSVTYGESVNTRNIKKWVAGERPEMGQVVDEWLVIDPRKPLFVDGNGGDGLGDKIIWSSSLSQGFDNVRGTLTCFADEKNGYSILSTGTEIKSLYRLAYNRNFATTGFFTFIHGARVQLIAEDTSLYYSMPGGETQKRNMYNYQVVSKRPRTKVELQHAMQADLDRYFGLTVSWEKQMKKCLVWSMEDSTKVPNKVASRDMWISDTEVIMDSVKMKDVVWFMEEASKFFYMPYPIIDETNYKGPISGIHFFGDIYGIKEFDKNMRKYGMRLTLEMREVDILVLKENPNVILRGN